ncbi:MAG: hypothetical protein DMG36_06395 [Acidobacteria bacterium]|nr:MAG: hypothetical protein DMG36_06395 [Acidobacteriota bacterium]
MKIGRLATQFQHSMLAFVLVGVCPPGALAQNGHLHETTAQPQQLTSAQSALLKVVRDNTERFKDVSVAEREGYSLLFGCVSGPDSGAMGLHYVNLPLVAAGVVDATRPQIVIYEPMPDGRLQLIGADFLVIASDWDKAHPGQGAPQLMGQLFHYFESPNRFGLPAFYTLHVWAWKENPNGAFVNWHPNVSCQSFAGQ